MSCVWLISLSMRFPSRLNHMAANDRTSWLYNIPLCAYSAFPIDGWLQIWCPPQGLGKQASTQGGKPQICSEAPEYSGACKLVLRIPVGGDQIASVPSCASHAVLTCRHFLDAEGQRPQKIGIWNLVKHGLKNHLRNNLLFTVLSTIG